ncbi:hypothetical protein [Marinobacterium aestuariivivens]|uniref:Arginase n=1 Tax=Marinobacterium aestuariivivens TaxID=1698799 RepID=A0ABW2A0J8_9GAMM
MSALIELPLDPGFVSGNTPDTIRARLRQIVRSLKFAWDENSCLLRILGPDTGYHAADPDLPGLLKTQDPPMDLNDLFHYRSRQEHYDLCFEDCWSGYFIADELAKSKDDLVLIHLDDHTDMMPSFLLYTDEGLVNPASGRPFDPQRSEDWTNAINAGCVSIGDFITPLLYANRKLHVRHLNNVSASSAQPRKLLRASCFYPEIPEFRFASLKQEEGDLQHADGSYLAGTDPERVLANLPRGQIILHIDLDYFINDFNGNVGAAATASHSEMRQLALLKLNLFLRP